MCVQVWVVCLSADGRPYSGGWLLCACARFHTVLCVCMGGVLSLCMCFLFFGWGGGSVHVLVYACVQSPCSPPSGVMPAVSPVWGQAGGTAAAVPAVTACRRECVLLTPSAQTVSQPSSITCRLIPAV